MSLLAHERSLYVDVWGALPEYSNHSPGEQWLPVFLEIVGSQRGRLLDAGCGSGRSAVALSTAGFDCSMCDLTEDGVIAEASALPFSQACLWHSLAHLGRFDYVYCCDVIEHLPPQFTMLAIAQLLAVATRGIFLSVSLVEDRFGVWIGEPLHQTVQPYVWWLESLRELGEVTDARDLIMCATFFVRPR